MTSRGRRAFRDDAPPFTKDSRRFVGDSECSAKDSGQLTEDSKCSAEDSERFAEDSGWPAEDRKYSAEDRERFAEDRECSATDSGGVMTVSRLEFSLCEGTDCLRADAMILSAIAAVNKESSGGAIGMARTLLGISMKNKCVCFGLIGGWENNPRGFFSHRQNRPSFYRFGPHAGAA